jgi:hypothetical protein
MGNRFYVVTINFNGITAVIGNNRKAAGSIRTFTGQGKTGGNKHQ